MEDYRTSIEGIDGSRFIFDSVNNHQPRKMRRNRISQAVAIRRSPVEIH